MFIYKVRLYSFKCKLLFFDGGYSYLTPCLPEEKGFGLPVLPWMKNCHTMRYLM